MQMERPIQAEPPAKLDGSHLLQLVDTECNGDRVVRFSGSSQSGAQ
jgi:hypothetical protein